MPTAAEELRPPDHVVCVAGALRLDVMQSGGVRSGRFSIHTGWPEFAKTWIDILQSWGLKDPYVYYCTSVYDSDQVDNAPEPCTQCYMTLYDTKSISAQRQSTSGSEVLARQPTSTTLVFRARAQRGRSTELDVMRPFHLLYHPSPPPHVLRTTRRLWWHTTMVLAV
jgi:hypothetical protein